MEVLHSHSICPREGCSVGQGTHYILPRIPLDRGMDSLPWGLALFGVSELGAPPNKSRLCVRTSDTRGRLHPTAVLLPWPSQPWATTKGTLFAAVLERWRLCLKYSHLLVEMCSAGNRAAATRTKPHQITDRTAEVCHSPPSWSWENLCGSE